MQECFLLISRVVVTCFEVEDTGVNSGTFQPVCYTQHSFVVATDIVVFVHWIDGLDCL